LAAFTTVAFPLSSSFCRLSKEGIGETFPAAKIYQQAGPQEIGREIGSKRLSGELSNLIYNNNMTLNFT